MVKLHYGSSSVLIGLIGVILSLALLVSIGNSYPVDATAENTEETARLEEDMMNKHGFSREQAVSLLTALDNATFFNDNLESSLSSSKFAGVWIDDNDVINIGVTGSNDYESSQRIEEEAVKLNLVGRTETKVVKYSYSELIGGAKEIAGLLEEANKVNPDHIIVAEVIPSINVINLLVPKDDLLTEDQRNLKDKVINSYGDMVQITEVNLKFQDSDDCSGDDCEAPLRGGVRITGGGQACTSGFIVRGKETGNRYVLTAGHCSPGTGTVWTAYEPAPFIPTAHTIGPVTRNEFVTNGVDAMIIRRDEVNNYLWTTEGSMFMRDGSPAESGVTGPSRNTHWSIDGFSGNTGLEGERVCNSGISSGSSCGRIKAVGIPMQFDGGPLVHGGVRASLCAQGGDSGGSVVRGNYMHHALGIYKGEGIESQTLCDQYKYYTGISSILIEFDQTFELVTW